MLAGLARDGVYERLGIGANSQPAPLMAGPVQTFPGYGQSTPGSDLQSRVWDLHGLLDPFAQGKRTTSIVRALQPNGNLVDVVSSSEPGLSLAQRTALKPGAVGPLSVSGEIEAFDVNPYMHAEIKGLTFAKAQGWSPVEVAVAGPNPEWAICPACTPDVFLGGALPISPFEIWFP